jgi:[protein-PII] uridylyltransferase
LSIKRKYKDFYLYGKKIGLNNVDLMNNKNLIFDIFIFIGNNKKINKIDTFSSSLLRENLTLIDHKFKNNQVYANKFIEILKSKYNLSSILKTMKDIGILQKYIPEFDEVVGQMQFDLFHAYTVDEHTFKLVRNMRQMKLYESKEFKLEYELINKLPKIEILYLAGFFHDLGKGKGGDHSIIGAESSIKFAKRMGLSLSDGELISWLVENHLLMSSISQKKDIYDGEIINHFVELVENTEKLDYLYLLTINDIKATNPALWNGWKHKLLKDLFLLARSKINKEPIKKSIEISQDRKNSVLKDFDAKNFGLSLMKIILININRIK